MKTLERKELVGLCKEVFERDNMQEVNALYAVTDGQLFIASQATKGNVIEHCKKHNLDFFEITRAEAVNGKVAKDTAPAEKALDKMNKLELIAFGSKMGLELLEEQTKADMIAVIKGKQEGSTGHADGDNTPEGGEGAQE